MEFMGLIVVLMLGLVGGGFWLFIVGLRKLALAVLMNEPWIKTVYRIAFPLYAGTWGTHWVMSSARMTREMGDWGAVINVASIGLMTFALTSLSMRFMSRRSALDGMMTAGFFACIGAAIGCSLLLNAF